MDSLLRRPDDTLEHTIRTSFADKGIQVGCFAVSNISNAAVVNYSFIVAAQGPCYQSKPAVSDVFS
jgi:hypothetical protein